MRQITLTQDHTEAGVKHFAGNTISVSDESYDFIVHATLQSRAANIISIPETKQEILEEIKVLEDKVESSTNLSQGDVNVI